MSFPIETLHHRALGTQVPSEQPLQAALPRSEAISLPDMVESVCTELRPLLAHHRVTVLFNGGTGCLPLVFGQRGPLRAALWECLEAAIIHARLGVEHHRSLALELVFSTDANQVHLSVINLGAIEEVSLDANGCARDTRPNHPEASAPARDPRQHVVFPFARVLLQSLGGQVVVHQGEAGALQCTLSLPCASAEATEAAYRKHHAQIYAGLLTRLTQNERVANQTHAH